MYRLLLMLMTLWVVGCKQTPPVTESSTGIASSAQTLSTGGKLKFPQTHFTIADAHLKFKVFPKKKAIEASALLEILVLGELETVALDLDSRFVISQVKVNQQRLAADNYTKEDGVLKISLPNKALANQNLTIQIDYSGQPHEALKAPWDGGFVWSKTRTGEHWIATAVQGEGCDIFWPCIDHPRGEPSKLTLSINVPKPLVAASNGILQKVIDKGERRVYQWRTLTPINNYAVSLNIGPFQVIQAYYMSQFGHQIDMQFYHLPENKTQAEGLFSEFALMLTFFEQMIGPYPFSDEKMAVVETPHLGMEHQTINAYGNDYKVNEFGFDTLLHHEFAHEWFGNQLTNFDWRDMWLHEGFATYMQPLYAQYLHGDMAYMAYLYKSRPAIRNQFPIASYQAKTDDEVYLPQFGPAQDLYVKGAHVLHSLRYLVGDDVFFTAIKKLVYGTASPNRHNFSPKFGNTDEFIQYINELSGREYQWFFDIYLFQAELPELIVEVKQNYMTFDWKTPNGLPFPMPLEVSINGETRRLTMVDIKSLLIDDDDVVIIDPHAKILRHAPHIGRYQQFQAKQNNN